MAAKHAGIKEFTGDEASNLFLGQGGFHLLPAGSWAIGATEAILDDGGPAISHTGKDDGIYWCAIKAVNAAAVISARSYNDSDDFTQEGTYAGEDFTAAERITVADGDIIYGAFDAITVATDDFVMAYIGK